MMMLVSLGTPRKKNRRLAFFSFLAITLTPWVVMFGLLLAAR